MSSFSNYLFKAIKLISVKDTFQFLFIEILYWVLHRRMSQVRGHVIEIKTKKSLKLLF